MPTHLVGDMSGRDYPASTERNSRAAGICLHIGLVNNMPDGALKATERQFLTLLDSAADGIMVHVSLYALPDVPRTDSGRQHVSRYYSSVESLWDRQLDGLIVTGTEPRASDLTQEPYWGSLTKLIEWAEHNTHSAVWSCLAAHAAVLHNDSVGRRRLGDKRFGVLECARASDHRLMAGVPSPFRMPHSRWNEISESELLDQGYQVLTRGKDGDVDAFVKQRNSLFVFFQGHPEYEVNTLLLEYRRDVGRYLSGKRDTYPSMPEGYFDCEAADIFTALRKRALHERRRELLAEFPIVQVEENIASTWRPVASQVYGNWLAYLRAQKARRMADTRRRKRPQRKAGLPLSLPRAGVSTL